MLQSVLIGIDGSAFSQAAIALALRWARSREIVLIGIGIVDEPTIRASESTPIGAADYARQSREARLADARHRVHGLLESFSEQCEQAEVRYQVLEVTGLPYEQIVLESQRYDLVMLGQQTFFHFETHSGPGDTLQKVLKHCPRPVITVPEQLSDRLSVMVAYDGSVQAARSLQAFQSLLLPFYEDIHIITLSLEIDESAVVANRAVEFLAHHGRGAEAIRMVSSDSPARVILDQIAALAPSLLVMGAYGQPTWREFLLGSVTRAILKEARVPLFLSH